MKKILWMLFILIFVNIVLGTLYILLIKEKIKECEGKIYVEQKELKVVSVTKERTICDDQPFNLSCYVKMVNETEAIFINNSYFKCEDPKSITLVMDGKNKKITYDNKGCYVEGDLLTCISRIDGYSNSRGHAFLKVCRSGETCKQWNITTGKIIKNEDAKDEIQI